MVLTISDVKLSKKGPPATPRTFESGMRALRQYKIFLFEMFGNMCGHYVEINLIYLSLRALQNRTYNNMGQTEWAHLCWAIIVDARQYFGTFTDATDLANGVLPVSNLATLRSIIQAHTALSIIDTPRQWLPAPVAPALASAVSKPKEGLSATSTGSLKRKLELTKGVSANLIDVDNDQAVRNDNMHPLFAMLMQPAQERNVPLSVSRICKACGILGGLVSLKKMPKRRACYRWPLRKCTTGCKHKHLSSKEVSEDFAKTL